MFYLSILSAGHTIMIILRAKTHINAGLEAFLQQGRRSHLKRLSAEDHVT